MPRSFEYHLQEDKKNLIQTHSLLLGLPYCVTQFINARSVNMSTKTQLGYTTDIKRFFTWWKSALPELEGKEIRDISTDDIQKITSRDIEDYILYLQTDSLSPNGKSGIARKISALSSLFRYLYRHDDIPADPCAKIERPNLKKNLPIVRLTNDEVGHYLDAIKNGCDGMSEHQKKYLRHTRIRDFAIATLLLQTGIRVSECVNLNTEDYLSQERKLKIFRKGGKYQHLPLSDAAIVALDDYLVLRANMHPSSKEDSSALFLSTQLTRLKKNAIENMINKYAEALGIKKNITPHKLRKTYGTELYHRTRDVYLVANALGHENIATTTKHYVDDSEDSLRKVINELGNEFYNKNED